MDTWIFITGATGGLGKAFAVECASRGWNLFLTDLQQQALANLACGLENAYPVQVIYQVCDLTDEDARTALFKAVHTSALRFSMLINVAGTDHEGLFYERTSAQIRNILRLNIEATLEITHTLLVYRQPLEPFRIINVASLAAFYPMPIKATYAASKRFLLDFSLALREEIRDLGATVTVLCPAGLPTTLECRQAIEAQGLMGHLTTQDIGFVATRAIDYAQKGRPIFIPGWLNRSLQILGGLLPTRLVTALIGARWHSAHRKRSKALDAPFEPLRL